MSEIVLFILIFTLSGSSRPSTCSCKEALESDVPHGANESVEYTQKTVKEIKGHISYYYDDHPAEDVVVEVYAVTDADQKLAPWEIVRQRDRSAACITSKDGRYCFSDLPSGRYVLRAGTRSSVAGFNEAYMKVNLDRRWWTRWFRSGKGIKLGLTPGT